METKEQNKISSNLLLGEGWIPVNEKLPPKELFGGYLVCFKTNQDERMICVATFQYITQHCFENPPMHPKFFVYPSMGHEVKPTHWMELPPLPTFA